MTPKDAAVIKALAELGLRQEVPLTPEQEDMLRRALDPYEQYLEDIVKVFTPSK